MYCDHVVPLMNNHLAMFFQCCTNVLVAKSLVLLNASVMDREKHHFNVEKSFATFVHKPEKLLPPDYRVHKTKDHTQIHL